MSEDSKISKAQPKAGMTAAHAPAYQITKISMCSYYETISSNHIKDIPTSGYGLGCR